MIFRKVVDVQAWKVVDKPGKEMLIGPDGIVTVAPSYQQTGVFRWDFVELPCRYSFRSRPFLTGVVCDTEKITLVDPGLTFDGGIYFSQIFRAVFNIPTPVTPAPLHPFNALGRFDQVQVILTIQPYLALIFVIEMLNSDGGFGHSIKK
jgi:hypothetical protein